LNLNKKSLNTCNIVREVIGTQNYLFRNQALWKCVRT